MRATRALIALLLAATMAAAGARSDHGPPYAWTDVPAGEPAGIQRLDAPTGSHAFLAPSPVAPAPAAEESGRSPLSTLRLPRLVPFHAPLRLEPARVAALAVSRLAFARDLDAARLGYFSFGSTAPPPFHG